MMQWRNQPQAEASRLPSFACPFLKRDSYQFARCLGSGLASIWHVRVHLEKDHVSVPCCPRCGLTFEGARAELDAHIASRDCRSIYFSRPLAMKEFQLEAIRAIGQRDSSEDRWYLIWEVLFPDITPPDSPWEVAPFHRPAGRPISPAVATGAPCSVNAGHPLQVPDPHPKDPESMSLDEIMALWNKKGGSQKGEILRNRLSISRNQQANRDASSSVKPAGAVYSYDPLDQLVRAAASKSVNRPASVSMANGLDHRTVPFDAPNTDSGYWSVPRPTMPAKNPTASDNSCRLNGFECPQNGKEDDAETSYTAPTLNLVESVQAQRGILDVCNDMINKLTPHLNGMAASYTLRRLPELIKAFSIRLGYNSTNRVSREAMCFVHKNHQEITSALKAELLPENKQISDSRRKDTESMSLEELMALWDKKGGDGDPETDISDYFEGVEEQDNSGLLEPSRYTEVIINSAAYQWLISTVQKEASLHWGMKDAPEAINSTRDEILHKLPTGTISRRRPLKMHRLSFKLPLLSLRFRLHHEQIMLDPFTTTTPATLQIGALTVLTGSSSDEIQLTTVNEYLRQTWSSEALSVLSLLQRIMESTNVFTTPSSQAYHVSLPGIVDIEATADERFLTITGSGLAYSLAQLGEQLTWFAASLHGPIPRDNRFGCLPSLEYHSNDVVSVRMSYEVLSTVPELMPLTVPYFAVAKGYPIARRPEGFFGVELSFSHLLGIVSSSLAEAAEAARYCVVIEDSRILLRGNICELEMIREEDGVYLWHIVSHLRSSCSCRLRSSSSLQREEARHTKDLQRRRHIIWNCEIIDRSSETVPMVSTQGPDGHRPASIKLASEPESPPALSVCHGAADNAEESLDSDLFSIPGPDESDVQALDLDEGIHPVVNAVATRLFAEHQARPDTTSTTSQRALSWEFANGYGANETTIPKDYEGSCNGSPDGRSPQTTAHVPHSGRHPSLPRIAPKRRHDREEEDEEDEERAPKRPVKKKPRSDVYETHKRFSCPFLKRDPVRYRRCFHYKLGKISYVKQHLANFHYPLYCERCYLVSPDEESHDLHMMGSCVRDQSRVLEGISNPQRRLLAKKSKPTLSEDDKWFDIWDIVFPDLPRPSSPYISPGVSEELYEVQELLQNRGPEILEQELAVHGIVLPSGSMDARPILRAIMTTMSDMIFSRLFESHPPMSASATLGRTTNSNEHRSIANNPPALSTIASENSVRDSAVVMQSLSSISGEPLEKRRLIGNGEECPLPSMRNDYRPPLETTLSTAYTMPQFLNPMPQPMGSATHAHGSGVLPDGHFDFGASLEDGSLLIRDEPDERDTHWDWG